MRYISHISRMIKSVKILKQDKIVFTKVIMIELNEEFDPGSGRTLAALLTHASRTEFRELAL